MIQKKHSAVQIYALKSLGTVDVPGLLDDILIGHYALEFWHFYGSGGQYYVLCPCLDGRITVDELENIRNECDALRFPGQPGPPFGPKRLAAIATARVLGSMVSGKIDYLPRGTAASIAHALDVSRQAVYQWLKADGFTMTKQRRTVKYCRNCRKEKIEWRSLYCRPCWYKRKEWQGSGE
jgi:hypothetical protein